MYLYTYLCTSLQISRSRIHVHPWTHANHTLNTCQPYIYADMEYPHRVFLHLNATARCLQWHVACNKVRGSMALPLAETSRGEACHCMAWMLSHGLVSRRLQGRCGGKWMSHKRPWGSETWSAQIETDHVSYPFISWFECRTSRLLWFADTVTSQLAVVNMLQYLNCTEYDNDQTWWNSVDPMADSWPRGCARNWLKQVLSPGCQCWRLM